MATPSQDNKIHALIDYEDPYIQPLLLSALQTHLPPDLLVLLDSQTLETLTSEHPDARTLQWRQYESLDFDHLLSNPATSLANSYIIRKALIRKHYLSSTVAHWVAKHPESALKGHVKPGVEFELDYAEFLDDALDQAEAWELRESWRRNKSFGGGEREWWILKPGMSERGQGIRLFSSEEELRAIFEGWDPPESDEEDEEDEGNDARANWKGDGTVTSSSDHSDGPNGTTNGEKASTGVMTSHLRHFIAQPYIHPPLLLPPPHLSANRKFHIRAYVLAVGALKVYVYKPMLALFAAEPYLPPSSSTSPGPNEALSAHLTNTCLQSGEREGSVEAFWSLPPVPDHPDWQDDVFSQIRAITAETFEAAARGMSVHFQTLPNAFEIFGLDFLVDGSGTCWSLLVKLRDFDVGDPLGKGLSPAHRYVVVLGCLRVWEVRLQVHLKFQRSRFRKAQNASASGINI